MTDDKETITVEQVDISVVQEQDKAAYDKQIETAKKYPRNIQLIRDNIVALVSMDIETAKSCGYCLPRGGKNVFGPSVHLARMIIQQYGNTRIESRIVDIGRTHIKAQATCIDLQNNIGIRVEVLRRITNQKGEKFNDDMITVTGNAAAAIALRNAVFNVVPKPLIDAAYNASRNMILGDVSDEQKLLARRQKMFDEFSKTYGVNQSEILKVLNLREPTQVKADEIVSMLGLFQALKDGDTTVNETFGSREPSDAKTTDAGTKANAALADTLNKVREKQNGKNKITPNEQTGDAQTNMNDAMRNNAQNLSGNGA